MHMWKASLEQICSGAKKAFYQKMSLSCKNRHDIPRDVMGVMNRSFAFL